MLRPKKTTIYQPTDGFFAKPLRFRVSTDRITSYNVCYTKLLRICEISGEIGPKRRSRDLQVPEGFYHISELNPFSKYYLSLKINYPNASDSIKGVRGKLGNLIYMHGGCESSGCIAVTNDYIKELYIYCVEAYNSGQHEISMTIYPSRLTDTEYKRLTTRYQKYKDEMGLWASLKESYDFFEQHLV